MIQNADDAGATTVRFYVDERQHSTSNLPHPDLAMFQGPALVAANNACFTEEDWEGIQSLQQSIKAEDPFKVGRFGIGFNSVYHLTGESLSVAHNHWFVTTFLVAKCRYFSFLIKIMCSAFDSSNIYSGLIEYAQNR